MRFRVRVIIESVDVHKGGVHSEWPLGTIDCPTAEPLIEVAKRLADPFVHAAKVANDDYASTHRN